MRALSSTTAALRFGCLLGLAAFGCTKAVFQEFDAGQGGAGTGGGGSAGAGGGDAGSGGDGGTTGVAGTVGGVGGGGSGGSGSGGSGSGGSAGGSAGTGGTGGTAGTGGTGGTAGTGGSAGRGGSGGTGGSAGTGGTAGSGGRGGTGGNPDGGLTPMGVTPSVAGQIVVTELMHDSSVVSDDNAGEWFEVYNPSATVTYDLLNCELRDTSPPPGKVININMVMPPMTFRVFAVSASPGFTPDFVYTTAIKFDNQGPDQAAIDCNGVNIDTFGYPLSFAGVSGRSFSVDPDHYSAVDNDIMTNWCAAPNGTPADAYNTNGAVSDYGTPGRANQQCP